MSTCDQTFQDPRDAENLLSVIEAYEKGDLSMEDPERSDGKMALFWGGKMISSWINTREAGQNAAWKQLVCKAKAENPEGKLWYEMVSLEGWVVFLK